MGGKYISGEWGYCSESCTVSRTTTSSVSTHGCVTTGGDKPGQSCVFPFKYYSKTCPGPKCCNLSNNRGGNWCSTKVDSNGEYISGEWGYCSESRTVSRTNTSSVPTHGCVTTGGDKPGQS